MRGNIGEYIIPSYRFFSKLNMFNNTPIIIDEIGKVKNQQAYIIVVFVTFKNQLVIVLMMCLSIQGTIPTYPEMAHTYAIILFFFFFFFPPH